MGRKKFLEGLETSNEELLEHANNENRQQVSKQFGQRFKGAVRDIVRRERDADRIVLAECKRLEAEDRYGYFPREKPNDAYRLYYENFNSLCVFTGNDKIDKINGLAKHYQGYPLDNV